MTAGQSLRRLARTLWRMPERLLHPLRRGAVLRRLRASPRPRGVLFVCHGNICRSPYAAAYLKRLLPSQWREAIQVESAGFIGPGRPCPQSAVELAAAQGLDLSQHRSQALSPQAVDRKDLLVVMSSRQRQMLQARYGRARRDIVVLGDLDPEPIDTREIEDPVDRPGEILRRSYARIERCVRALGASVATSLGTRGQSLGREELQT